MTQPFFPYTISAQSRNNEDLTIKTVVRKTHQNNGHTGSWCLDKAVLAQGGRGTSPLPSRVPTAERTQVKIQKCHIPNVEEASKPMLEATLMPLVTQSIGL